MAARYTNSYQMRHGIHLAVADLVRLGMAGDVAGVEALAGRLAAEAPTGIREVQAFSEAVELAVANARGSAHAVTRSLKDALTDNVVVTIAPSEAAQRYVFNGSLNQRLKSIVRERESYAALLSVGLSPVNKVLVSGEPGVGKTMSAHWLAGHLGLPLLVLDLARTMSSFLGESGKNIRLAFAEAKRRDAVFLIDEFDALAKRRDDAGDVGELKRLVNILLLELDAWDGGGLLIAATNHAQLLDPAIQRRFDEAIVVPLPDKLEISALVRESFGSSTISTELVSITSDALSGKSNSDVVRFCRAAYRSAIVENVSSERALLQRLAGGEGLSKQERDDVWRRLDETAGLSARSIAQYANVSHPTVSAGIVRSKGNDVGSRRNTSGERGKAPVTASGRGKARK